MNQIQDTNFKPKSEKLKKKEEKYNEKIIYWDGRQKQKHYDWNNPQLYQCRFQCNINLQPFLLQPICIILTTSHVTEIYQKSQALFISFLTSQAQKSTTSYHLQSFTKTEKIVM
jgi:hypothetical protein